MKSKALASAYLALAFTCSGLFGQVTWNGNQNGGANSSVWATGSNWSSLSVPISSTDIEFGNYTGSSPGTGNTIQPANNVSFKRTSGSTIISLSSTGGLNAGGTISSAVGAQEVFLRGGGTLSGANLIVNNVFNLGSRSTGSTNAQIGNVTISGTTAINSGGVLHAASLLGTTNLGALEMSGNGTFNLVAGGNITNGIVDGATNNITVTYLNGSGTITGAKTGATLTTTGHLTINGSANGAFSGNITNGLTNNVVQISKAGSSTLTLSGNNSYSGATTVNAGILLVSGWGLTGTTSLAVSGGTLQLGAANVLNNAASMAFSGGNFSTGATIGFSEALGTLDLNTAATLTLALGTGVHSLNFADSSAVDWTGSTLTITGWTGTEGTSGTAGKIFFGSNASGLTSDQLSQINFAGYSSGALILSTGEIVAIPEPATWMLLAGGLTWIVVFRKRWGYLTR